MRRLAESPDYPRVYPSIVERTPTGGLSEEDAAIIKGGALAVPAHVMLGGLEAVLDPSVWEEDAIDVPVLLIHAASPHWSADYEAFVRRLAPDLEYHAWEGASHFLQLERPDAVNESIREFASRIGAGPGRP